MKSKLESNVLNRRAAIFQTLGTLGVLLTANSVLAQEQPVCPVPEPKLVKVIESEIGKNHGHEFMIELSELVKAGGQSLDIQGESGHPHTIVISNDQIIALMKGEQVVLVSSKDAGHTHQVTLVLLEKNAE